MKPLTVNQCEIRRFDSYPESTMKKIWVDLNCMLSRDVIETSLSSYVQDDTEWVAGGPRLPMKDMPELEEVVALWDGEGLDGRGKVIAIDERLVARIELISYEWLTV